MKQDFRVVIPKDVDGVTSLTNDIYKKHQNDGANSLLHRFDMDDMNSKRLLVKTYDEEAFNLNVKSMIATEQRNHLLGLKSSTSSFLEGNIRFYITSVKGVLLGSFKGDEKQLGHWGFEVNMNSKGGISVKIPHRSPEKLIDLAENIIKKHHNDAASSLLNNVNFDMVDFENKTVEAKAQHTKSKKKKRESEAMIQLRNNVMGFGKKQNSKNKGTLNYYMTSIRDVLLGNFRENPWILGEWGFEVNEKKKG